MHESIFGEIKNEKGHWHKIQAPLKSSPQQRAAEFGRSASCARNALPGLGLIFQVVRSTMTTCQFHTLSLTPMSWSLDYAPDVGVPFACSPSSARDGLISISLCPSSWNTKRYCSGKSRIYRSHEAWSRIAPIWTLLWRLVVRLFSFG